MPSGRGRLSSRAICYGVFMRRRTPQRRPGQGPSLGRAGSQGSVVRKATRSHTSQTVFTLLTQPKSKVSMPAQKARGSASLGTNPTRQ